MQDTVRSVIPAKTGGKPVAPDVMRHIHEQVKTPHKGGIILRGEENQRVDGPAVFRHNGRWYMRYVGITGKIGYETFLATSDDLIHWNRLGKVLSFQESGWDKWNASAGMALQDPTWGGSYRLDTHNGKYWFGYMGGALQGYETDPLSIGMAWSDDPSVPKEWNRRADNPVLSTKDQDVREFESVTLYKSHIIHDPAASLGFSYVMFYNGKNKAGCERIGMAVSNDMVRWRRYGAEPVIANGKTTTWHISGNPQLARIGDVWVMFYFGAFWKPRAFDTFACSYDLVSWTKWEGQDLIQPSEPWDNEFAHKPWVIMHEGVVYHYYCAVGNEGRVIALATSVPIKS
jgi:predicted GH43/DUF377 family glycosyl hydrolase